MAPASAMRTAGCQTGFPPDASLRRFQEQRSRRGRRPRPGHDQEVRLLLLVRRRVPERRRYHPPRRQQGDGLAVKLSLPRGIARLRERNDRRAAGDHRRGRLKETVGGGGALRRAPVERRGRRLQDVGKPGELRDRKSCEDSAPPRRRKN